MPLAPAQPHAPRLVFRLLEPADLSTFHALALDEHVLRFLLDGRRVERAWCEELIAACALEFARTKLGMWLLFERTDAVSEAIGFAGFWRFDGVGSAPQLLYALRAPYAGRGYASEAAVALIDFARSHGALAAIDAAVDEPNVASCRVLEQLGFQVTGDVPGAFGRMLLFRLPEGRPARRRRTARLLMRPFHDRDRAPFAAMNADSQVMEHFPARLARAESDALLHGLRTAFDARGYGLWALELRETAQLIGFTGLAAPSFTSHFTPCVEIGWRLASAHWGQGYATEAAREALRVAFVDLGLPQVVSFTAAGNTRSRRVMERLGMRRDPSEDFDHPALPVGDRLRRHVLYRLDRTRDYLGESRRRG